MNDEDMDNFVFAIYPKRTAGRMQKELQDLVCGLARLLMSSSLFDAPCLLMMSKWEHCTSVVKDPTLEYKGCRQ
jgi:hypothetical protein